MFLISNFTMKLIRFTFIIKTLLLTKTVCTGCDNECDIRIVPDATDIPVFLGEVFGTQEDLWFKLEESFDIMTIQLKIDAELDFQGDKISDQNLTLSKEDLLKGTPLKNANQWNKIKVEVVQKEVSWAPDLYIIKANVKEHIFVKDTGLWWRFNTIKSIQFLAKGGSQVSVGCHPCETTKSETVPVILTSMKDHLVGHRRKYKSHRTEICGTSPWIYVLIIICLLVVAIILLIMTFKYLYTRQNAIYKKKASGLPYLEGNYFKEENIYDGSVCSPESNEAQEENIYDEINAGSSSKDPQTLIVSTSTRTTSNNSEPRSSFFTKSEEAFH